MLNPLTQRRILKHGIAGTAEVLRLGYQYGQSSLSNRELTLRVQVPGMEPYDVDGQWMVRGKYVDDLQRGATAGRTPRLRLRDAAVGPHVG